MKTIYADLLFDDEIRCDYKDIEIFKKAGLDPDKITIKDLLWCGSEIANNRNTMEGVELMNTIINVASYYANEKGHL